MIFLASKLAETLSLKLRQRKQGRDKVGKKKRINRKTKAKWKKQAVFIIINLNGLNSSVL